MTNVLLVVFDSLRTDVVFGDRADTPNMSRWADEGASFTECIATCTSTTPSFASLITGCYPPAHGVIAMRGYRMAEMPNVATVFADAGYHTRAEVTGPLVEQTGIFSGFHTFNHRRIVESHAPDWPEYIAGLLRSLPRPWFVLLHVWETHRPYAAPPDFKPHRGAKGYIGAVEAVDGWIRPVVEEARKNSIVVLTGDHGERFAPNLLSDRLAALAREARSRVRFLHRFPALWRRLGEAAIGHGFTLDEAVVRVPLIIMGPDIRPVRVTTQVRHVDLLPTLCDLLDIPSPETQGLSLRPELSERAIPRPAYMRAVGLLGDTPVTGVRDGGFKLIRSAGRDRLFRLPDETTDVSTLEPEALDRLVRYLEQIESQTRGASGMTAREEQQVAAHLESLGYI